MERRPDFRVQATEPVMIAPFRKGDAWPGQFVASSCDEVKVQLDEDLEIGSILKLETSDIWILGEVVRCQASSDGFRADLTVLNWIGKSELKRLWDGGVERTAFRGVEKRKHSRAAMTGALRILWHDDDGRERVSRAQCANISRAGMRFQVADRIPSRATIMFNSPELGISGRGSVRSLVPRKLGFEIGVECTAGTGWKTVSSKRVSEA